MPSFEHDEETKAILNRTIRDVPDDPDPLISARSLSRGTTITGLMLEDLGSGRGGLKRPSVVLKQVGQVAWGLVELAAPHSLGQILFQYWIALAFALAALMILVGLITGAAAVARAGYVVLAACVVIYVVVEKLRLWMDKHRVQALKPIFLLVPLGVAVLVGFGCKYQMNALDRQLVQNGARYSDMSHHLNSLNTASQADALLGSAKENAHRMTREIEWEVLFILSYVMGCLSLGWIVATQFDRPYRAFVWVVVPLGIALYCDLAQDLEAYLVVSKRPAFAPFDFSYLELSSIAFAVGIVLLQVVLLRSEHSPLKTRA